LDENVINGYGKVKASFKIKADVSKEKPRNGTTPTKKITST
jgi:hypothetical protein